MVFANRSVAHVVNLSLPLVTASDEKAGVPTHSGANNHTMVVYQPISKEVCPSVQTLLKLNGKNI